MCFAVKDFICDRIFRCFQCKIFCGDSRETCCHSPIGSPKVRLRKFASRSASHELFSDEMGSNRTGEVNFNKLSGDGVSITNSSQRNGTDTSLKSSQTPEYVKRTAKLFETVQITEKMKNGESKTFGSESSYFTREAEERKSEEDTIRISLDCLDGEANKKPSYLGVSCSNSGYRNVINYDSKLREGFWSANSQRESLVLSSSRLRECSPLRRDFDFKPQSKEAMKIADVRVEKRSSMAVNGVSRPEKFVNISTSTKTISTFRNSKDIREEELENGVNGGRRLFENGGNPEATVNLKQILNGKGKEPYRKGYSNLGFSPKILKSPEKNCNSFLKSISSFENNCKKSQAEKNSSHAKMEQRMCDSNNSIQQRIERLYGPGALAQGFYTQKSQSKTKILDSSNALEYPLNGQIEISTEKQAQIPLAVPIAKPDTSSCVSFKETPLETATAAATTNHTISPAAETVISNGHPAPKLQDPGTEQEEKNGHYFLRLLKKETSRLEQLATLAEAQLENGENLPEEVSGKLRAAAGKARLLVCQKLHQFEGLCQKNLNEKPGEQFSTTSEDLAGFWDMVMLQVVQVYGVFDELEQLKKNNWKAIPTKMESPTQVTNGQSPPGRMMQKKSTTPNATSGKQSVKSDSAKKAREEGRRKMLEERRKKMKELKENKIISTDNEVEIFAK